MIFDYLCQGQIQLEASDRKSHTKWVRAIKQSIIEANRTRAYSSDDIVQYTSRTASMPSIRSHMLSLDYSQLHDAKNSISQDRKQDLRNGYFSLPKESSTNDSVSGARAYINGFEKQNHENIEIERSSSVGDSHLRQVELELEGSKSSLKSRSLSFNSMLDPTFSDRFFQTNLNIGSDRKSKLTESASELKMPIPQTFRRHSVPYSITRTMKKRKICDDTQIETNANKSPNHPELKPVCAWKTNESHNDIKFEQISTSSFVPLEANVSDPNILLERIEELSNNLESLINAAKQIGVSQSSISTCITPISKMFDYQSACRLSLSQGDVVKEKESTAENCGDIVVERAHTRQESSMNKENSPKVCLSIDTTLDLQQLNTNQELQSEFVHKTADEKSKEPDFIQVRKKEFVHSRLSLPIMQTNGQVPEKEDTNNPIDSSTSKSDFISPLVNVNKMVAPNRKTQAVTKIMRRALARKTSLRFESRLKEAMEVIQGVRKEDFDKNKSLSSLDGRNALHAASTPNVLQLEKNPSLHSPISTSNSTKRLQVIFFLLLFFLTPFLSFLYLITKKVDI